MPMTLACWWLQGLGYSTRLMPYCNNTSYLRQLGSGENACDSDGNTSDSGNNVQFRSLVTNDGSYFALLNNAPWTERVECEWGGGQFASIEWISELPSNSQTELTKEGLPRSIVLQPFQLLAWRIPESSLQVISWHHRAVEDVRTPLAKSLEQLAVYLNRTATQHSSYQIENEDFEAKVTSNNPVPGWKTSILPSTSVDDRSAGGACWNSIASYGTSR